MVVFWIRHGWSSTRASVVGETSAWDPVAGLVINPRVVEEVFVGSQTRYYGGIFVRACMQDGWTALMRAARFDHLHIVQKLLKRGADADAQDKVMHWDGVGGG